MKKKSTLCNISLADASAIVKHITAEHGVRKMFRLILKLWKERDIKLALSATEDLWVILQDAPFSSHEEQETWFNFLEEIEYSLRVTK